MADELSTSTEDGAQMNIGRAIGEKLTESIRNMDVISMIQRIVSTVPEEEESEEIREKLQGILEKYNAMGDEEQEAFSTQLREALASKLSTRLQDNIKLDGLEEAIGQAVMQKLYIVAAGAIILIIILVFFGYKLYKSIKEKEKKREEKKKAKQMKKKK